MADGAHRAGRLTSSVGLAAVLALLAGCGLFGGDQPGRRAQRPSSVTATASPSPTSSGLPTPTDAAGLPIPAESAGPLDAARVPPPRDLGRGWTVYVDPGDVAEGYTGNGSWVRARGADEIVQAVVPLGCTDLGEPPSLPVPAHALEATYRGPAGAPGVAIVLDYASSRSASAFVAGMARIARSCPEPARRVGAGEPLTVVITPARADGSTVLDRRREYGAGASEWLWSEAVVRNGSRVGLLIVASGPGEPRPALGRLARSLRAVIGR